MKVYRIIVDQDKAMPDRFTWIIKQERSLGHHRTVAASMGSYPVGRMWVFPSAREAFEDALGVLCAMRARQDEGVS